MSPPDSKSSMQHEASLARARSFPMELEIDPTAFVAPTAVVVGQVRLAARSSIWFGAVLRGDMERIEIGEESNVQDNSVFHVDLDLPAILGRRVVVGHRAVVHGGIVEDDCLIGMGAILLNGCRIGRGSLVAAGAVVGEGKQFPPDSLIAGVPARLVGPVSDVLRERMAHGAAHYVALAASYRQRGLAAAPAGDPPAYLGIAPIVPRPASP